MDIRILECRKFSAPHTKTGLRIIKDYEIDLEIGEPRTVIIDGVPHIIERGNVCVRKPGQTVHGKGTQNTVLLTLDFSGNQPDKNYSRNLPGPRQAIFEHPLLEHIGGVIVPYSENTFIPIYNELLAVAHTDAEAAGYLVLELLHKLNAEIYRREYTKRKPTETACSKVLHYLKENLEKPIHLEALAAMVHLDKSYFVRLFRETYGQTPIQLLIRLRMELACDLIANTDLPVGQIAQQCGYPSPSYFSAEYKKHYGITPATHRRMRQSDPEKRCL